MAGDTLRGIGRKAIAEALEAAAAAERANEPNGTAPAPAPAPAVALVEDQARPERSLDEMPSDRTGHPAGAPAGHPAGHPAGLAAGTNHSGAHTTAAMAIITATTLVQEAPSVAATVPDPQSVATLPGTSTANPAMVDDAAPLTSSSSTSRSGPNRVSFGTMLGHEMHGVQARVATAVAESDAGIRGTAHGRDVHLPAHPAMAVDPETAPAAPSSSSLSPSLGVAPASAPAAYSEPAAASTSSDKFAPARDSLNEFSGGDHNFFATEPINDEYEPENPRGRLYTRLAVSGAVVAVVSVVVVAWVNSHGSSGEEPPPIEVKSQPAVTAPVPVRTAVAAPARPATPPAQVPPTSTIPSSVPERIAVTTPPPPPSRPAKAPALAPPAPVPPPRPAPIAAAAAKPVPIAAPAPRPAPIAAPAPKPAPMAAAPAAAPAPKPAPVAAAAPVRELRTPPPPPQKKPTAVAAAAPPHAATPPPSPPPAARPTPTVAKAPAPPSRPVAKSTPARASSKASPSHGKQKYDPDGTLPLSFE